MEYKIEYRCKECKRLLLKTDVPLFQSVSIKCWHVKCKALNILNPSKVAAEVKNTA